MKFLSSKEAMVESEKYEYDNLEEKVQHEKQMKDKGFKQTKSKAIKHKKWIATYVKFSPLYYFKGGLK